MAYLDTVRLPYLEGSQKWPLQIRLPYLWNISKYDHRICRSGVDTIAVHMNVFLFGAPPRIVTPW